VSFETFPDELKRSGLFCCWRYENRNGNRTKVPFHPISGIHAKSNDPGSFASFSEAVQAKGYDGIGIGIFGGVCAIDLDDCITDSGYYTQEAVEIIRLMHSYTEVSPSGTGLHILFRADGFQYDTGKYYVMNHKSGVEVYVAGATNKYVTVTGEQAVGNCYPFGDRSRELAELLERYMRRPDAPVGENGINAANAVSLPSDDAILALALKNQTFSQLWNGSANGFPSQSEADLALCGLLAFWTGKDPQRMDALFRKSGLMRPKWDERHGKDTYGALTVQKAIASCTKVFQPKQMTAFPPLRPLKQQCGDLPPFPVDCLPGTLRDYVKAVAAHSQTSEDMAAVIGLGVLAVCLQGKFLVQGTPGYDEPLSLYTVVIAAPGERKSSVMKDMTKCLYEYEQEFNVQREPEIRKSRQEQLMTMLMDPDICHFSLKDANAARKIVGKKQMNKIPILKEQVMNQASSEQLGKYIWDCGIGPQMGYSFSVIHALAYSFIAYQSAFLCSRWSPIYWDAACLVVNSESLEDDEESEIVNIYEKENTEDYIYEDLPDRSGKKKTKTADYAKIAKAIGDIVKNNIEVSLININSSEYGFEPDPLNNRILYGMNALSGVNKEMIDKIKAGRPYDGIKDFMARCPLGKKPMLSLIKAGAFDEIDEDFNNRKEIMAYYVMRECGFKDKLNLQNFSSLISAELIPSELDMQVRMFNFNKYLKANCKINAYYYKLDSLCAQFFNKFLVDHQDILEVSENGSIILNQKIWDKLYQLYMDEAREYVKDNQQELLHKYNRKLFLDMWTKYSTGTTSHWEMESVCFYHGEHELAHVNKYKYGLSDFYSLPEQPEVDYYWKRGGRQIPIYKLHCICGTVIAKKDSGSSITILTTDGVVTVKMTRDQYAKFKKQISVINPDGSKTIVEKSWFTRGSMVLLTGFRRDDQFILKTYKSTNSHQLYKIDKVVGDSISMRHERMIGVEEEEYE